MRGDRGKGSVSSCVFWVAPAWVDQSMSAACDQVLSPAPQQSHSSRPCHACTALKAYTNTLSFIRCTIGSRASAGSAKVGSCRQCLVGTQWSCLCLSKVTRLSWVDHHNCTGPCHPRTCDKLNHALRLYPEVDQCIYRKQHWSENGSLRDTIAERDIARHRLPIPVHWERPVR